MGEKKYGIITEVHKEDAYSKYENICGSIIVISNLRLRTGPNSRNWYAGNCQLIYTKDKTLKQLSNDLNFNIYFYKVKFKEVSKIEISQYFI
jgi:hypothetical protein